MMKHLLLLTGALLLSGSLTALADDLPHKGMTMKQVARSYGEPKEKLPPVGHPPISRWLYDDYTVYFDHTSVITTVVTGHPPAPAPKAAAAPAMPAGELDFKPIPVIKPDQMQQTDTPPAPASASGT